MIFRIGFTIVFLSALLCVSGLRVCSKFEACNLAEFGFPPPPVTTTPEPEGSGEGSGEEPLIYDENLFRSAVNPPDSENYTSLESYNLCSCPSGQTCPEANDTDSDNSVRLDAFLSLAFCRPVKQLFPHACRGRRALTRVFGKLGIKDPDPILTTTMESYTKTRIYCHCKSGSYQKLQKIETWFAGIYAYLYQCNQ